MKVRHILIIWTAITVMAMATNAQASVWTRIQKALGLGDEAAQVLRQSDHTAKTGMRNYDEAVEAGEIFPRMLDDLDDTFNTPNTKHLFSSLRTRNLVKTVGQMDAISDAGTALRAGGSDGFVLIGEKGAGKSQIVDSIEYKFRRAAARNPKAKESFVIKISTDSPDFKDLESFRSALNELEQTDKFINADTIVFYFDDLTAFKKVEGSADPAKLETYWDLLRRMNKGGQKIKVAAETDAAGSAAVLHGSPMNSRLTKILVKESQETDEVATIIRYNLAMPQYNADGAFNIADASIGKLVRWIKRYAPGPGTAQKAVKVLDNSMARIRDFLDDDMASLADEITDALKRDLSEMQDQLAKAKSLAQNSDSPAKHAQELIEELPERIAKLQDETIPASEKEYKRLLEIRDRRFEIQGLRASATGDEAEKLGKEYKELTEEALNISDRRMAIELAKVSGAQLADILKFTGKMTIEQFRKMLDENIIGQKRYKEALVRGARKIIDHLGGDPMPKNKPMFTIMMWGPPGTGKTDGYSMLAEFMDDFKIIPGGEYTDFHAASKLDGAPPGYVGYDNGGLVTNQAQKVSRTAYLLDDIQQSALSVYQKILGFLNPGWANDSRGIRSEFFESIWGVTTNDGWEAVRRAGLDPENITRKQAEEFINASYIGGEIPPQFFDRIDELVYVGRADFEGTVGILNKFIRQTNNKDFMKKLMLKVQVSNNAKTRIAEIVEETEGSARQVIREVGNKIETPLRSMMKSAEEVVTKPIKGALDQGHYIDDLTGEIRTLKLREGDLVELDWDEAAGFIFRVMD